MVQSSSECVDSLAAAQDAGLAPVTALLLMKQGVLVHNQAQEHMHLQRLKQCWYQRGSMALQSSMTRHDGLPCPYEAHSCRAQKIAFTKEEAATQRTA